MGIDSPYVPWGCHPELIAVVEEGEGVEFASSAYRSGPQTRPPSPSPSPELVRFVFPGGFLGHRKPLEPVLEAFERTTDARFRLVVKAQVERKQVRPAEEAAQRDSRIEVRVGDQPTAEHLRELAGFDVCVAPARWEGLGLPLYEAIAFGQPAITNAAPPMNEAIHDGVNGLLVGGREQGTAKSGIAAIEPDVDQLTAAFESLGDDAYRAELAAGAVRVRETERRWDATVAGIGGLLDMAASS